MENSIKKVNRCIAYNKNNKKCRAKIMNNDFFCCEAHKPLNYELIEGCFICNEKIESINEIYYFKCKHIIHKVCYDEWLNNHSNYDKSICMICRNEVLKKPEKKKKFRENGVLNKEEYKKMHHIFDTFNYFSYKNNIIHSQNDYHINSDGNLVYNINTECIYL